MTILLGGAFLALSFSTVYWVAVSRAVRGFFRAPEEVVTELVPSVSVLKPVKGLEIDAYENFAGFCRQDYPDYEVLFGVADVDDPVTDTVRQLQADFPERKIRLVFVPRGHGNPKSASLHQLASMATGDVLVMSDADIRAPADYLRRVTAPLASPDVGAVTCPYASVSAGTASSLLEALHLNVEFLPSAIFAHQALGLPVGLGATIAVHRRDLERVGGYAGLVEYLADDYQVVARIARLGLRVELSRCVVRHVLAATRAPEQWGREVRGALALRASSPWGYLGLVLTFTTPLALFLFVASRFSGEALALLTAAVGLRLVVAWRMQVCLLGRARWQALAWLPFRECLSLVIWAAGLYEGRVAWRGKTFILRSDGRLEAV